MKRAGALAVVLLLGACAGDDVARRDELAELHAEALGGPPGTGPALTLAGVEPEVLAWASYWSGDGRAHFSRWLARAQTRRPSVEAALAKEGLPASFAAVPLVESGFSSDVVSSRGAVGEWQLMPDTARAHGLRVDDEVDERRDPDRSAAAGAKYLAQLSRQFPTQELTWAAYNAGPRAVLEAMRAAHSGDFWVLARGGYLTPETANYVPKLLAAQLLPVGSGSGSGLTLALLLIGALVARYLFILVSAVLGRPRQKSSSVQPELVRAVSVVIPAFDEEASIARVVLAALGLPSPRPSPHGEREVVVVDDGSRDGTRAVLDRLALEFPSLVVIHLDQNQGKAAALNAGVARARGDVIVTVDADTEVEPEAIDLLADAVLRDARVGAAAGNVKVGNASNLLTRWQALEYVTAHHLDRRAQAAWGCITTVPGAAAAWRRQALVAVGSFSARTCTEDMDLTLTLLEHDWEVVFEPRALAHTTAPTSTAALFRQRLRWLWGNLQCAARHLPSLFRTRRAALGFLGLPNVWFNQLGVYLLLPVSIFATFELATLLGVHAVPLFLGLWLLDLFGCLLAFRLDGTRAPSLLDLVSQRLLFPFFSWAVFLTAMTRRLGGAPVGWALRETQVRQPTVTPARQ